MILPRPARIYIRSRRRPCLGERPIAPAISPDNLVSSETGDGRPLRTPGCRGTQNLDAAMLAPHWSVVRPAELWPLFSMPQFPIGPSRYLAAGSF